VFLVGDYNLINVRVFMRIIRTVFLAKKSGL